MTSNEQRKTLGEHEKAPAQTLLEYDRRSTGNKKWKVMLLQKIKGKEMKESWVVGGESEIRMVIFLES